jgi:haloalkane dehalogenase
VGSNIESRSTSLRLDARRRRRVGTVLGPRLGTISVEQEHDECYRVRIGDRVWLTHDPAALVPILEGAVESPERPGRNRLNPRRVIRRDWPIRRVRRHLRRLLFRRRRATSHAQPVEHKVQVFGTAMSYLEAGKGPPIVFLHGGVASALMWRRVMTQFPNNRCIAVDLVGTGRSDALPGAQASEYTWRQHARHLGEFLRVVGATHDITMVMHGWSPLAAYQWLIPNRDRLRGIAFVEAIVAPFAYGDLDEPLRDALLNARSDQGFQFVVESDAFVDQVTGLQTLRPLDDTIADSYRRTNRLRRIPMYAAVTGLPIGGEPRDAVELAQRGNAWLCDSSLPKLIVLGRPGAVSSLIPDDTLTRAPNLTVATTRGRHLLPEDSADSVALSLQLWLARVATSRQTKRR